MIFTNAKWKDKPAAEKWMLVAGVIGFLLGGFAAYASLDIGRNQVLSYIYIGGGMVMGGIIGRVAYALLNRRSPTS